MSRPLTTRSTTLRGHRSFRLTYARHPQLSSSMTAFYKFRFHRLWLAIMVVGFLAKFIHCAWVWRIAIGDLFFFAVLPMVTMIGFVIHRDRPRDFVDLVIDEGESLLVIDRQLEVSITFADIQEVNYMGYERPQRLTLVLRVAGPLGKNIMFIPRYVPFCFSVHPIAVALQKRVESARS